MNALLVETSRQVDGGFTDADISAIVEEFLRAQLDPGSLLRKAAPQIDPGGFSTGRQLDPGLKTVAQVDPGYQVRAQLDPTVKDQFDPGDTVRAQIDPGE